MGTASWGGVFSPAHAVLLSTFPPENKPSAARPSRAQALCSHLSFLTQSPGNLTLPPLLPPRARLGTQRPQLGPKSQHGARGGKSPRRHLHLHLYPTLENPFSFECQLPALVFMVSTFPAPELGGWNVGEKPSCCFVITSPFPPSREASLLELKPYRFSGHSPLSPESLVFAEHPGFISSFIHSAPIYGASPVLRHGTQWEQVTCSLPPWGLRTRGEDKK